MALIETDLLLDAAARRGMVDAATVARIRRDAGRGKSSLELLVPELSNPAAMLRELASDARIPYVDVGAIDPDRKLVERVPETLLRRKRLLPVRRDGDEVEVAMANPADLQALDAVERALGCRARGALAEPAALDVAIERAVARQGRPTRTTPRPQLVPPPPGIPAGPDAIDFLDDLLREAVARRATDVHVEPQAEDVRVRFRIDGVLVPREARVPFDLGGPLVSRVKVLAGLDIAERREPQDGAFTWSPASGGRGIDLRVATAPTRLGERVTIRLLGLETEALSLGSLGWDEGRLATVRGVLERPHGLVLLCGPTGSGKTTTLYALLRELNRVDRNVLTVEDPVEYTIPGVSQLQVDGVGKVTFASALRSLLRHDPDVLMVGEIRDSETADVAVKAAMTGHLVLSTLHTSTAASAVGRLAHLGVPAFMTATTLAAVVAQRLVRRICSCGTTRSVTAAEARLLGLDPEARVPEPRGPGCGRCEGTGYRGRIGIFELLAMDATLADAVARGDSEESFRHALRGRGVRTLREDGVARIREGITTVAEVLAATVEGH